MEEHIHHLHAILTVMRRDQFYVALKKCEFASDWVLFLCYVVSRDGLTIDQSKVEAIRSWPIPTTIMAAQSFHGLASFYRCFITHISSIVAPITDTI